MDPAAVGGVGSRATGMAFVVVLDANVLYGIEATDLLLTMVRYRLFGVHWSPLILDEVSRNLDPPAPGRLLQMDRAFPTAGMDVPAELVEAMPVNDKERITGDDG